VLSANLIAPDRKPIASAVALVIGGMLAWNLVGHAVYPENNPKAYQPTYIPFVMTITGGFIGLAGSVITEIIKRKPNKTFQCTVDPQRVNVH